MIPIVAGILIRPIDSDRLWYELSRGVAVLDGHVRPALALLANECFADADWLAGVPFAIGYVSLGVAGLMAIKLLGGAVTAAMLWRGSKQVPDGVRIAAIGLGMMSAIAAWDVSGTLWDVLGFVMLAWTLERPSPLHRRWIVFAMWSQFGSLVIIGVWLWLLWEAERRDVRKQSGTEWRRVVRELGITVLVCSLTPRRLLTLWDSFRLGCPYLAVDRATLADSEWQPLVSGPWGVAEVAFAVLSAAALFAVRQRRSPSIACQIVSALVLGWTCRANMAVAGMWLAVVLLQSRSLIGGVEVVARRTTVRSLLAFVALFVAAWWPWEGHRPGWGIDPRVDERLLAESLATLSGSGDETIWAADELSAGMCLWVTQRRFPVHDVPRRALLGGRLRDFSRLRRDLEQGRLAAYRRADASVGGWWLPLREARTIVMATSANRTELIRELEPTLWKPMAVDSAVLPFGQSGDPAVSAAIVNVLKQREIAESGEWSPGLMGPAGTDRFWDLWGSFGVSVNIEQEVRQSRVFRAMQLPQAARRILEPAARVSRSNRLRRESAAGQRALSFDIVEAARLGSAPTEPATMAAPAEFERCGRCHRDESESFADTGHHNALRRLDRDVARELIGSTESGTPVKSAGVELGFDAASGAMRSASRSVESGIPAQWLFGSGHHARTPVSVWVNGDGATECLEHRVSWYPHHGWAETLGLNQPSGKASPTGVLAKDRRRELESLGKIHHPAATRDCFGCHTTHSPWPDDGRNVDWRRIVPGVSCQRCHPGSDRHADDAEAGSTASVPDCWSRLSPLDSVNRCGECHRRADHFTPDELTPDNDMLIRFASVGLVQSACFREQESVSADKLPPGTSSRMDCTTCHDPHRPTVTDATFYTARCVACHDSATKSCSQQPLDSNCLECHMPKVEVQSPLRFTDHWIRVRRVP